MSQCFGYARFELQIDNIPHWQEDTIYGNDLFFEVQDRTYIVKVCLPMIRSYKGDGAPILYSTISGVRRTDLLAEYSIKEMSIVPTFFVWKVLLEVPNDCGTALFIVGMYFLDPFLMKRRSPLDPVSSNTLIVFLFNY